MARQGIGTGVVANDGAGDSLRVAGGKINDNFSEIYDYFGDGTNLTVSKWTTDSAGINTLSKVGIGTDAESEYALTVGAVGASGTSLYVNGDARVTGVLEIGTASIRLDANARKIEGVDEIIIGTASTVTLKQDSQGAIEFTDSSGNQSAVSIGPNASVNTTGIITAAGFYGSASEMTDLTGASAATYGDAANTPVITVDANGRITNITTSSITDNAGISSVFDDTTPKLGGNLDLNSNDITGTGNADITGIITATSFSGDGSNITGISTLNITNYGVGLGGGGISSVFDDPTPKLGGNLDLNSNDITGTGNVNITGIITSTQLSVTSTSGAVEFDGSGDYLSIPSSSDLQFGSGDFTVEGWIYLNSIGQNRGIVSKWNFSSATQQEFIIRIASDGRLNTSISNGSSTFSYTSSQTLSTNTWYHFAAVKNGPTDYKIYIDGVVTSSGTVNFTIPSTSNDLLIGSVTGTQQFFDGKISNLRIVKGSAVYTSAFTPPTPTLDVISGTSLLCCQSSSDETQEATGKTITVNGDAVATASGVPYIVHSSINGNITANNASIGSSVTAANFYGDGSGITGISTLNITNYGVGLGGGGISSVFDDPTPKLGGNLDLNSNDITGTGNVNITGVVTSTSFSGDGSGITGISTLNITNYGVGLGGGGISSVFDDTTPQLGGNLDLNSNDITGTGNVNITGVVTSTSFSGDGSGITGISTLNIVDYGVGLGGGGISSVFDDTTPQLGGNLDLNSNDITGTGNVNITGIITAANVSIGSSVTAEDLYINGNAVLGSSFFEDTVDLNASIKGNLSPSNSSTYDLGQNPGTKWRNLYLTGTASAAAFVGDGSGLTNLPGGSSAYSEVAGIATYTSEWDLGADGTNNYTFTGPGFTGAENDPALYLTRGQQYKFTNNMGAHPFRIQSTPNGSTGTQYNDGIVNNDVSNGTLTWDVQFDTPNKLYYQCTVHPNMGGPIYIVPRTEPAVGVRDVVSGTTGSVGAAATTNLDITGFKSYGLLKVGISSAAWVRLYVDEASRTSDANRSYLVDPSPGSGLIAEVRTETAGISTFLMTPGVIGWNNDVSVGSTIYTAVTNNEGSSATITVDLTVVKMED